MAGAKPRGPEARARGVDAAERADGRQSYGRRAAGGSIRRRLRFTESRSVGTSASLSRLPGALRDGIAYFVPAPNLFFTPKGIAFWSNRLLDVLERRILQHLLGHLSVLSSGCEFQVLLEMLFGAPEVVVTEIDHGQHEMRVCKVGADLKGLKP